MYVAAVPNYSVTLPLLHTCTIRHLNIKFPQSLGIATVAVLSERQLFSYRTLKSALGAKEEYAKQPAKDTLNPIWFFWGVIQSGKAFGIRLSTFFKKPARYALPFVYASIIKWHLTSIRLHFS